MDKSEYAISPADLLAQNYTMAELGRLFNLANMHLTQRRYGQAADLFRKIIAARPEISESWNGLGSALRGLYQFQAAEDAYRKAVELQPQGLAPAYNLALLLGIAGKYEEAVEQLRRALSHHPGNPHVIGELAWLLERTGRYDEAIATITIALDSGIRNVRVATAFQKLCRKMQNCQQAERYIKDTLATQNLINEERASLHFALGELYDRDGKYNLAFDEYVKANDISAIDYDPDEYSRCVDDVIRRFSPQSYSALSSSGNDSAAPIFIVGMPRSGTSLVEQILSSHSQVYGAGELDEMLTLAQGASATPDANPAILTDLDSLSQADINAMAEQYLSHIAELSPSTDRVTDKMPHNFQILGLIRAVFPKASIIHCCRDARDTCLSSYFSNFVGSYDYNHKLEHIGRHYRDYERLMEHWKNLGIDMLDVCYEELVADQEDWIRKLIAYCGLEWEEQCLHFYQTNRAVRTSSYDQVRQPVYARSIGRWRNYESQLEPLLDVLDT